MQAFGGVFQQAIAGVQGNALCIEMVAQVKAGLFLKMVVMDAFFEAESHHEAFFGFGGLRNLAPFFHTVLITQAFFQPAFGAFDGLGGDADAVYVDTAMGTRAVNTKASVILAASGQTLGRR